MAQIDLTPELSEALRVRLAREFAETSVANFAMDILLDAQALEIAALKARNDALQERCAKQDEIIEQQKLALGNPAAKARARWKERRHAQNAD